MLARALNETGADPNRASMLADLQIRRPSTRSLPEPTVYRSATPAQATHAEETGPEESHHRGKAPGVGNGMNGSLLLNVDRASTSVGTLVVVEAPVLGVVSGSVRSD